MLDAAFGQCAVHDPVSPSLLFLLVVEDEQE